MLEDVRGEDEVVSLRDVPAEVIGVAIGLVEASYRREDRVVAASDIETVAHQPSAGVAVPDPPGLAGLSAHGVGAGPPSGPGEAASTWQPRRRGRVSRDTGSTA